jgi:uncharacterized protein (TIGR00369 family)
MKYSKEEVLMRANQANKNTLMETLEIEMVDYGEDFLVARMPVTPRVHQPDGVLHGGATAALAESVGSFEYHIILDSENFLMRGCDCTANH